MTDHICDVTIAGEDFLAKLYKQLYRGKVVIIRTGRIKTSPVVEMMTDEEYSAVKSFLHRRRKEEVEVKATTDNGTKRNTFAELIVAMNMTEKEFLAYWHPLSRDEKEELRTREL